MVMGWCEMTRKTQSQCFPVDQRIDELNGSTGHENINESKPRGKRGMKFNTVSIAQLHEVTAPYQGQGRLRLQHESERKQLRSTEQHYKLFTKKKRRSSR